MQMQFLGQEFVFTHLIKLSALHFIVEDSVLTTLSNVKSSVITTAGSGVSGKVKVVHHWRSDAICNPQICTKWSHAVSVVCNHTLSLILHSLNFPKWN